jgi:hypothetical protein
MTSRYIFSWKKKSFKYIAKKDAAMRLTVAVNQEVGGGLLK